MKKEIKNRIIELKLFIKYSSNDEKIAEWNKEISKLELKLNPSLREELLSLGFKTLPHYTVMNSLIYDLGRGRQISIGSLSTPNEMVFLSQVNAKDEKAITDIVVLRNYDYDGYTTLEDIEKIITAITGKSI